MTATSSPFVRVDDHVVRLPVARAAHESQGSVHLGQVGAAQVVDRDRVGAAEGVEVDRLDVVQVHDHVRDVAGEQHPPAVRPRRRCSRRSTAPLNSIVSKPPWPSSVSLSSPGFQTKVSSPAPIRAVSLPSPPLIRSPPSLPRRTSLAEAAVHRQLDAVGLERRRVDDVVAAQGVERQPVVGLLLEEDVDRGLKPEHVDAAGVARGAERVGAVGAVDGDRVGRAVAAAVRARAGRGRPG